MYSSGGSGLLHVSKSCSNIKTAAVTDRLAFLLHPAHLNRGPRTSYYGHLPAVTKTELQNHAVRAELYGVDNWRLHTGL